jgi:hypothetical protein
LSKNTSTSPKPGFCWVTDGKNFTDIDFFTIEYVDFEGTSVPDLKRPKCFHIASNHTDLNIDLYLETKNMHEYLWGIIPVIKIGLWEGSCSVNGTIIASGETLDAEGKAISEILRII